MKQPEPNRPYVAVDNEIFHKQSDLEEFEKLVEEKEANKQKELDKPPEES